MPVVCRAYNTRSPRSYRECRDAAMKRRFVLISLVLAGGLLAAVLVAVANRRGSLTENQKAWIMQTQRGEAGPLPQSDAEWKDVLTPEQYRVLRKKGTERAFTGEHWDSKADGMYRCAGCGQTLFGSDAKFDSGTGWPSFWQPVSEGMVATEEDRGFFTTRTEVLCSRCGGHLGHVFDDGPQPTGLRYCINSAALHLDENVKPETGSRHPQE
jgi:peptide-methionine (R)-S-oxide reductase